MSCQGDKEPCRLPNVKRWHKQGGLVMCSAHPCRMVFVATLKTAMMDTFWAWEYVGTLKGDE